MVFHITNYMRETNVWQIRKFRWVGWSAFSYIIVYRNVYWDYLGRRVAWADKLDSRTEAEKQADANKLRANWGYTPRYTPVHDFSIKQRKYDSQTEEERIHDAPRLRRSGKHNNNEGKMEPVDVRSFISVVTEHNRQPGVFDYNFNQNFYSTFPHITRTSYITLGGGASASQRRVHNNE
jgi:hypothetical protein